MSFVLILLAALVIATPGKAREMRIDIAEQARASVTEDKLARDIGFLSAPLCAGRATGTTGAFETASWLSRRFAGMGLETLGDSFIHSFKLSPSGVGRNVIGLVKGSAKARGYIIIAASYDGLGIRGGQIYPGADSNASGVAAMLSLAGMMTLSRDLGREYGSDVIFVALDAKNQSFGGSAALWEELQSGRLKTREGRTIGTKDVLLMVNIDQVGSSLSPLKSKRKDYLIMLGGNFGKKEILQANKSKDTGLDLAFDYYGSKDFTDVFYRRAGDQKVFVEHNSPAVLFTSGITMNNNKLTDTLENLDLPVLRKRIYLIWNWTERIAGIIPASAQANR